MMASTIFLANSGFSARRCAASFSYLELGFAPESVSICVHLWFQFP